MAAAEPPPPPPPRSAPVRVLVRCRPPLDSPREGAAAAAAVSVDEARGEVAVRPGGGGCRAFAFDRVFGEGSTQRQLYEDTVRPTVRQVLRGYNATVLAYGQTGSGKTFTMTGPPGAAQREDLRGIVPRALADIFDGIAAAGSGRGGDLPRSTFLVRASYLQICARHACARVRAPCC